MGVVASTPYKLLLAFEAAHPVPVHPRDELLHFRHDFGADAVAGKQKKLVTGHGETPFIRCCEAPIATGEPL
jgi:hypothetical protein